MNNVSDTPGSVYINNMTPELDSINKTNLPMRLIGQMDIKKEQTRKSAQFHRDQSVSNPCHSTMTVRNLIGYILTAIFNCIIGMESNATRQEAIFSAFTSRYHFDLQMPREFQASSATMSPRKTERYASRKPGTS